MPGGWDRGCLSMRLWSKLAGAVGSWLVKFITEISLNSIAWNEQVLLRQCVLGWSYGWDPGYVHIWSHWKVDRVGSIVSLWA